VSLKDPPWKYKTTSHISFNGESLNFRYSDENWHVTGSIALAHFDPLECITAIISNTFLCKKDPTIAIYEATPTIFIDFFNILKHPLEISAAFLTLNIV
jgi:hypothetical protein